MGKSKSDVKNIDILHNPLLWNAIIVQFHVAYLNFTEGLVVVIIAFHKLFIIKA